MTSIGPRPNRTPANPPAPTPSTEALAAATGAAATNTSLPSFNGIAALGGAPLAVGVSVTAPAIEVTTQPSGAVTVDIERPGQKVLVLSDSPQDRAPSTGVVLIKPQRGSMELPAITNPAKVSTNQDGTVTVGGNAQGHGAIKISLDNTVTYVTDSGREVVVPPGQQVSTDGTVRPVPNLPR